jgi:FtsZ-interacting cell division protein ZipA
MSTVAWIILVVAIVVVVAIAFAAWSMSQRKRSDRLRTQFGPEYDRAVDRLGDRRQAESVLEQRRERVEKLNLRELSPDDRSRFADAWRATQAKFVDSPAAAITDAERLVNEVMQARGYPTHGDFDQRAADISVDHPTVVSNYRDARSIAIKNERGQASTEDLRQAMVHYRALFEDLLGAQQATGTEARR